MILTDPIRVDVPARTDDLDVPPAELQRRRDAGPGRPVRGSAGAAATLQLPRRQS